MTRPVEAIVAELSRQHDDLELAAVRAWKAGDPSRRVVGCMPVFAPREVVWAAGALPLFIRGGGDRIETIRGDAYYQSYICRLPRSTLELALAGYLDCLDGMLFPNTCDVIRNLSGIWPSVFAGKLTRFLDPPQTGPSEVGIQFWRGELGELYRELCALSGREPTSEALSQALTDYGRLRAAARVLAAARAEEPWNIPAHEAYLVGRAGDQMPPLAWAMLVEEYLEAACQRGARREDRVRIVLVGSFCEQPPLGLLRALERAGCYLVADDLLLSQRDLAAEPAPSRDPLGALARAYVEQGAPSSVRFDAERARGQALVARVRELGADGAVFAAPSFCDPALLDQPRLTRALDEAGVPYTALKYAENTGQFGSIREQAGTFSDSVKLWGHA